MFIFNAHADRHCWACVNEDLTCSIYLFEGDKQPYLGADGKLSEDPSEWPPAQARIDYKTLDDCCRVLMALSKNGPESCADLREEWNEVAEGRE